MGHGRLVGLIFLVTGIIALAVTAFRENNRIREIIPKPWLWVVLAALMVLGVVLLLVG